MDSPAKRIRLMVVDDNDLLCGSLERWFGRSPAVEFLGGVVDGLRAVDEVVRLRPDVVLLDVDIPQRSGLDILAAILAKRPETKILMLSGHLKREYVERSLALGAMGYVLKDVRIPDLAEMVTSVAAGNQVLCHASQAVLKGAPEEIILASP
jgi:DNA-binding NarL/FixJ family response regulator